jgi:excisionase family DNA binding protein
VRLIVGLAARLAVLGAGLVLPDSAKGAPGDETDRNLSVGEAARVLGVSERYVYRNAKRLPFVREGRRLLFPARRLAQYQARGGG